MSWLTPLPKEGCTPDPPLVASLLPHLRPLLPRTLILIIPSGHVRPLMSKTRCSKIFSPPTSHSSPFFPSPPKNLGSPLTLLRKIDKFQHTTFTDVAALKQARKHIKKAARNDKRNFIASNLLSDFHGSSVQQWTHARQVRSDFEPRSAGMLNTQGKLVSSTQRAKTLAGYLAHKIWYSPHDPPVPVSSPHPNLPAIDAPFTLQDFDNALRKLKPRKAPGPNDIPGEIYKHAPFILKLYLLDHYNQCYHTCTIPDSWLFSEVVMLVKNHQKDIRSLSNYRPISLTNVSYKIFASMLQSRLESYTDSRVRDTQYGFRKNRSTTQPIHVMRRLIEMFERQNTPFHALFVDWSKAFDSVTFTSIQAAMEHAGIPAHTRQVIMALYNNPTFVVRDSSQKSSKYTQTKGLRQGCPLSPYLFGLVLTHLFYDVEQTVSFSSHVTSETSLPKYGSLYGEISGVFHVPSPLWDLEYADDTVLLSCSAQQLNRLFHIAQYHGQTRGLQINEEKCEHLRLHSDQRIYYSPSCSSPCDCRHCSGFNYDLSPVPLSNEVKYLGVYLDSLSSGRKNLNYRVSQAVSASKLLRPLLSHSSLPPSWKLTVYRSIVLSILTYAMDSALLSPSQIQKMNTIHFKSLRRIFEIKSSLYHRVLEPTTADCSNEYLAGLAYDSKRIPTPSQLYSQQRLQLLGHLYRYMDTLEYQVTFAGSRISTCTVSQ